MSLEFSPECAGKVTPTISGNKDQESGTGNELGVPAFIWNDAGDEKGALVRYYRLQAVPPPEG